MTLLGDCSKPFGAPACHYSFRHFAIFGDVSHGPNPAVHAELFIATKQAIVASKNINISLICHQYTNIICAAAMQVFKTHIDVIYVATSDGNHRFSQQKEKKGGGATA